MLQVLDKGYVRFVDKMGSDLSVVNAARVSFEKESAELNEKDVKLLRFLADHDHTSPFRHASMAIEVYAPLMVARQMWKYCVGASHVEDATVWNESSRRYVTEEPLFMELQADDFRRQSKDKKQGSEGCLEAGDAEALAKMLKNHQDLSINLYNYAISLGCPSEQARLFLPAYGMYVRWRWSGSLAMWLHMLDQRLHKDAQYENQQYARAIAELIKEHFPQSMQAWCSDGGN